MNKNVKIILAIIVLVFFISASFILFIYLNNCKFKEQMSNVSVDINVSMDNNIVDVDFFINNNSKYDIVISYFDTDNDEFVPLSYGEEEYSVINPKNNGESAKMGFSIVCEDSDEAEKIYNKQRKEEYTFRINSVSNGNISKRDYLLKQVNVDNDNL